MAEILVNFHQIWKYKYSKQRLKVKTHVRSGIWDCEDVNTGQVTQVSDTELLEDLKLVHGKAKGK